MDEIKAISLDELRPIIEERYPSVTFFDWFGKEIAVRRTISLSEMMEFVDAVADACVDENGEYYPQFRFGIFRVYMVMYYTNIALDGDLNDRYMFVYSSPLFDAIMEHIDGGQINSIQVAIDNKIRYITDVNIRKFNDGVKEMLNVVGSLKSSFSGITAEELSGALKALSNMETVDEAKLVQAVADIKSKKKPTRKTAKKPTKAASDSVPHLVEVKDGND